ncbi:MAG TPA: hypothetical protein GX723_03800, partial [Thermoanaerobacterales bacterium]|nr:hypothetical protein [Thermoanaerobacterales bacterium]
LDADEKGVTVATLDETGKIPLTQIPDGIGGGGTAEDITYDNAESGLVAEDVQGAIDEVSSQLAETMNYLNDLGLNVLKNGAKGDGVTDDTLAIQSAVDYVASRGGGAIYFPQTESYYKITESIKITTSNISLLANGATIKCEGVFSGSGSQDLAAINIRNNNNQIENIKIKGFEIHGPQVGDGIEGYGIHVSWAKNVIVSENNIYNCDDSGIRVDGYGGLWGDTSHTPRTNEGFTSYVSVENNNIYNTTAGSGIELISYPTHCSVVNNKIKGCQINGLRIAGAYMTTISNNIITDTLEGRSLYLAGRALTVTGNVIDNSIQSIGVYLNDLHDSIINNNTIQNSGLEAIFGITTEDVNITIKKCIISNNTIKNWGTFGGSAWAIVIRGEGSDDNLIENNIVIAETSGERGINVQELSGLPPEFNIIRNNLIKNLGSSVLIVNGTVLTGGSNQAITNIDLNTNRSPLNDTTKGKIFYADSYPTTGKWMKGDIVYKNTAVAGDYIGWVCISATGSGTWKGFGLVEA